MEPTQSFRDRVEARRAQTAGQQMGAAVNTLAPYAQTYSDPYQGQIQMPTQKPISAGPQGSTFQQVLGVGASVAKTAGSLAVGVGKFAVSAITNLPGQFYRTATNTVPTMLGGGLRSDIRREEAEVRAADKVMDNLIKDYAAGSISKEDYVKGLKEASEQYQSIGREATQSAEKADPIKAADDLVSVGMFIATLGLGSVASAGAKAGSPLLLKAMSPTMIRTMTKINLSLEKGLSKVSLGYYGKLFDESVNVANMARATRAGNFIAKQSVGSDDLAKKVLIETSNSMGERASAKAITAVAANKLLIKYPLTYHVVADDSINIYDSLSKEDYQGAAGRALWGASALLSGGMINASVKAAKRLGLSLETAVFGKSSFIDELSGRTAGGDRAGIANILNDLKNTNYDKYMETIGWVKSMQAMNLHTARGDVKLAVDNVAEYLFHQGNDISKLTPKQVFEGLENYGQTLAKVHRDLKSGLVSGVDPSQASSVLLGRIDRSVRDEFADAVVKAGTKQEALRLLEGAVESNVAWTHNDNMYQTVKKILDDIDEAPKAKAKVPKQFEGLVNKAKELGDFKEFKKYMIDKSKTGTVDEKLVNKVWKWASEDGKSLESAAKQIRAIDAGKMIGKGWSKETKALMKKNGLIPIVPKHITDSRYIDPEKAGKVVTGFVDDIDNVAQAVDPLPVMGSIGTLLRKTGLSTQDTTAAINRQVRTNLDNLLQDVKLEVPVGDNKGLWVANKLSQYMESLPKFPGRRMPAQDARTLRIGEIQKALGTDRATARSVQKALINAYTSLPMELRGLGDKIVDKAFAINPLQRAYSRVQGTLRYSWNPFFRAQEMAETEILSQALVGGKMPQGFGVNKVIDMFFKQTGQRVDDTVKLLDNRGVFSGTLGGEAAQDALIGRITANITQTQKRSLAGMALKLAKRKSTTVENMLNNDIDEVADLMRVIVQYPKQGAINSPLAKTINLAFFPARYNLKVAGLAAQVLAKQPPAVQYAVINGAYDMAEWLKTDEGIHWQSENQDAIRLFKWITPYGSIEWAMNALGGGRPESAGEFGVLGGLPFGVITQMIDSQTQFEVNTPYVDLKDGRVFPDYIPESVKARAVTAIHDLIGSVFTYPGRLVGLPGKGTVMRSVSGSIVEVDSDEYDIRIPVDRLTPMQRKQVEVLTGNAPESQTDPSLYNYEQIWEGIAYDDRGYVLPLEVTRKLRDEAVIDAQAGTKTRVEKLKAKQAAKRPVATKRVARPIQQR